MLCCVLFPNLPEPARWTCQARNEKEENVCNCTVSFIWHCQLARRNLPELARQINTNNNNCWHSCIDFFDLGPNLMYLFVFGPILNEFFNYLPNNDFDEVASINVICVVERYKCGYILSNVWKRLEEMVSGTCTSYDSKRYKCV